MPNNVNYNDERFTQVENEKDATLSELEQTYGGMVDQVDDYYNAQIDASKEWADKQSQLQQEQTDFTIEQIEQQKQQANKDYTKEQSGAYVDWQKQSQKHGVNAEQMAQGGMTGTGFSESSQVGMYNQYQNRVATARESYNQAVLNYNNAIKDARLQNNSVLADIAYKALQQQLELSLQGFQYKNQLILEQANKKLEVDQMYYNRYQDVLNQINHENAVAEDTRQFNEQLAEEIRQYNEQLKFNTTQAELDRQFKAQQAELDRQHDIAVQAAKTKAEKELLDKQHQQNMEKLKKQHEYDLAMLKEQKKESSGTISKTYSGSVSKNVVNSKAPKAKEINISDTEYQVSTAYYRGDKNPDAKTFGTFSNGYQPRGISGYGEVTKTGDTFVIATEVIYGPDKGKKQKLQQNIWSTGKGKNKKYWYWDGRQNEYIEI